MNKTVIIWIAFLLTACSNNYQTKHADDTGEQVVESASVSTDTLSTAISEIDARYIETTDTFAIASGGQIIIQNSFPKGGGDIDGIRGYTDAYDIFYAYAVLWTSITNQSERSLQLHVQFPSPLPEPYEHLQFFLPPDRMAPEKAPSLNFGIVGLRAYLDEHLHQPSELSRAIPPNSSYLIYVVIISDKMAAAVRAGFKWNTNDLIYDFSILPELKHATFSCGSLVVSEK